MSSEATQTTSFYDLLAWLETNKKPLIVGFVAAVVIGFAIAAYRYASDRKELAASDALLKVKTSLGANASVVQPEPAAYLRVAEQFPGTAAGERALLLAGSTSFTSGKYQEAHAQFTKFLSDRPQSPFAATAAYGIATSLEAQNKTDEALTAYQNLSVRYPNSAVLNDAKLAIARIYEAKSKPDMALRAYDELVKPGAMSMVSSEAMTRRSALLARHPELVKTNLAAAASTLVAAGTNAVVPLSTNLAPVSP